MRQNIPDDVLDVMLADVREDTIPMDFDDEADPGLLPAMEISVAFGFNGMFMPPMGGPFIQIRGSAGPLSRGHLPTPALPPPATAPPPQPNNRRKRSAAGAPAAQPVPTSQGSGAAPAGGTASGAAEPALGRRTRAR